VSLRASKIRFFFSSRRRHTRFSRDWSSDVCSSDLNIINFAHGALYMLGAFLAWMGLSYFGLNYWVMLVVAPLLVGAFGILLEKTLIRHLYKLDHLYGLLLTFGITLLLEGVFRSFYGVSGQPYATPAILQGGVNLGFM